MEKTYKNGKYLDQFIDENNLVILNDGTPTRFNAANGNLSCLDLGIVSSSIASKCIREVDKEEGMGRDHFPVFIVHQGKGNVEDAGRPPTWNMKKIKLGANVTKILLNNV